MDRAVAKKKENAGSFTGVRYRREPFGGDLAAMEMNRNVEEGEAMEMRSLPPEARPQIHAALQGSARANKTKEDGQEYHM